MCFFSVSLLVLRCSGAGAGSTDFSLLLLLLFLLLLFVFCSSITYTHTLFSLLLLPHSLTVSIFGSLSLFSSGCCVPAILCTVISFSFWMMETSACSPLMCMCVLCVHCTAYTSLPDRQASNRASTNSKPEL